MKSQTRWCGVAILATTCIMALLPSASAMAATEASPQLQAADCSVSLEDRFDAAQEVASTLDARNLSGTPTSALRTVYKYLRICPTDNIRFDVNGVATVVGAKPSGQDLPSAITFPGTKMTTLSSCSYTLYEPIGSGSGINSTLLLKCPVVATMKSDTCIDKQFAGGGGNRTCRYQYYKNVAANKATFFQSWVVGCSFLDLVSSAANPSRFANGSWAGPGWMTTTPKHSIFC